MVQIDYKALCMEIAQKNSHVTVLTGNDQEGRPRFAVLPVVGCCQINKDGRIYWGEVCMDFETQTMKWYPYNDVVGYVRNGKVWMDGLDRCLKSRYRWMKPMEAMLAREAVELIVKGSVQ